MRGQRLLILLLLAVLAASVAAAQADGGSHVVELRLNGTTYLVELNVSTSRYVVASKVLDLRVEARIIHPLEAKNPVLLVLEARMGNISLGSTVLGRLLPGRKASATLVAPVPPQALPRGAEPAVPGYIVLVLRAYSGGEEAHREIMVPVVVVEEEPGLQVAASYGTGSPLAVQGRDLSKTIYVRVVNTGSSDAVMVRLRVSSEGRILYSGLVAEKLRPGGYAEKAISIPVPQEPGEYRLNITAAAVCGASPCSSSTGLTLVVAPRVQVLGELLNSSIVAEGERVCIRATVYPPVTGWQPLLVLETRPDNAPSWSQAAQAPLRGNSSTAVLCTTAATVGSRPTMLHLRPVLLLHIDGLIYRTAGEELLVEVEPVSSLLGSATLTLTVTPLHAYITEDLHASIDMAPRTGACLPLRLEVFRNGAWVPAADGRICRGHASVTLQAGRLGTGKHLLRAVVQVGSMVLASNPATVEVYPLPSIHVTLEPPVATPRGKVVVHASLEPAAHPLRLCLRPGWSGEWINVTGAEEASAILEAPPRPGEYVVTVCLASGGFHAWRNITLRVASPRLSISLNPSKAKPGQEVRVKASLEPPVPATIDVALLGPRGEKLAEATIHAANGTGETILKAPSQPGSYKVTARAREYNATAEATLVVEKQRYTISLTLNATTAKPGAPIEASVRIQPPPGKPVLVAIMAAPESNTSTWQTLGTVNTGATGAGKATIHAPGKPGTYIVKAAASSLHAESNTLRLTVTGGKPSKPTPKETSTAMLVGAAVAAAMAWTLWTLRKR